MNKRILLILLLLPVFSFAQTRGSIKGIITDATHDFGLQLATVTVYKKSDSSLVNYQVTNARGVFTISGLPLRVPLLVGVSFTGYYDYSQDILLDSLKQEYDFDKINLHRDTTRQLEEVVVKSVIPVRMNGDTLEINPQAFKLDASAVAEDMLLRVPGVTMWSDGTITVNGKKVTNVYVDGKPFFGNNPELATQNLPKNAIEKIQVYQEKDYSKQEITNTQTDSLLTMNIKLRADKRKGYFGKVDAGIGSDKRYDGNLTLQAYNNKNRLGIAGNLNNTNKAIENVQAALQGNTFRSFNRRNFGAPDAGASGLNTAHYFGATFQHSFNESTNSRYDNAVSGTYDLRDNNSNVSTNRTAVQNLNSSTLTTLSGQHNNNHTLSQTINGGYQNRKAAKAFAINGSYSWNHSDAAGNSNTTAYKNDTLLASRGHNTSLSSSMSQNMNLSAYFNNNDYDEGINKKSFSTNFSLSHNASQSDSKQTSSFQSLTDSIYTNNYNRKYHNENSGSTVNLGLNYNGLRSLLFGNYNFWNINIGLKNNIRYSKSDLNANVGDFDSLTNSYRVNSALTNINSVTNIDDRSGISFSKTFTRLLTDRYNKSLSIRTDLQNQFLYQKNSSTLSYRNAERSYHFFTPSTSINYNYNRFNKYNLGINLSHSSSASAPTIDQLYPIIDSINRYNITIGNPNLKSPFNNSFNFDINYNSQRFNEKNTYTAGLNLGYNMVKNDISDSSIYNNAGGRSAYLINIDKRSALTGGANANVAFHLNKNTLQVGYNGGFSRSASPRYIKTPTDPEAIQSVSSNRNINHSVNIFYGLLEVFNITLSQSINRSENRQTGNGVAVNSTKATTYATRANLNVTPLKDLSLASNINFITNHSANNQSVKATLWNASAAYRFLQSKQAEIKFFVFDILRQNKNIANTVNGNTTATSITNGLTQYYMLSLSYFPRQFGGRVKRSGSGRQTPDGQPR